MIELDFTYSPWFLLICALIAGAASWFLYRKTKEFLPTWAQYLLTVFRFVVFMILSVLLLEPLLNSFTKIKNPPIIAVIQDNSESLVIHKDSAFVKREFPGLLNAFLDDLGNTEAEVQFFSFDNELISDASPDSLTFDRTGTNISGALKGVSKLYKNQNLSAVVLVSDGISNSGISPVYALEDLRQPVYTVLLGDTSEQKDIRISEVLYNEIAYLESETPLKVKLSSTGFGSANLAVTLDYNGKVLATENVQVSREQPNVDVDFLIKPDQVGIQRYAIHVTEMGGEITYRNNHKAVFINVLETRIRIGIVAGGVHPDLGALHEALKRDERYEVTDLVKKTKMDWYTDPGQYNLKDFDLLILHNFPAGPADMPFLKKIGEEVNGRNLPLMVFYGIQTDLNAAKPLFDLTGIQPSVINRGSEEVQVNFKAEYMDHSTFTFERDWINLMNSAPPLYRNRSDWQAKGDATVFGTSTIKGITLDYPVYALQNHLGKKNVTFVGENIWRVRSHVMVETGNFDAFDTWLFNNIQWLIVTEDKRKFKVRPSKGLFTGNEPIILKGQAYDDSYNPIDGAEIKVLLKGPDGKENTYYMNESGEARYFLELNNLGEGTYSYSAEGKKDEITIGGDQGQFSIGRSNIEHFRLRADRDVMQQVALRTDGKFVFARDIASLSSEISSLETLKPVVDYKKNRRPFQDYYWVLALLVGLLAVEWILRKIYSMI